MDVCTPAARLDNLDIPLSDFEGLLRGIQGFHIDCREQGGTFRKWFVTLHTPAQEVEDLGYVEAYEVRGKLHLSFYHPYRDSPLLPSDKVPENDDENEYEYEWLDYQDAGHRCVWLINRIKDALRSHGVLWEDPPDLHTAQPTEVTVSEGVASKENEADPSTLDPTGGKYGTCRDLTIDDVRTIVAQCLAFQERDGKVPEFYRQQNIDPGAPRSYELETLRGWLYNPKFRPLE